MKIDYSRDELLHPFAKKMLQDRYLIEGEISPQEGFARAANAFSDDAAHAQRLYDYASKHWFMFATPILSNGGTNRGLPISCYLNFVGDSREDIMSTFTENAFLASNGGGIGTGWSAVRSNGTKTSKGSASTGIIPFIKVEDSLTLAFSQGVTRRGNAAVFLDISHPEIEEFLDIRKPSGDTNRRSLNIHHGVTLSDEFMSIIDNSTKNKGYDDSWNLIDPHTGLVTKTVSAKVLWIKILQNRVETGEPYLVFIDTVNEALPDFQKKLGLRVSQSNLCVEITQATDENRTAICCLSSVNAEKWDEWKNNSLFLEDILRMLDNVLTHFIKTAPSELYKAIYSAQRERSVGLGLMGFHALLQNKNVSFESEEAKIINKAIFKYIKSHADIVSNKLAEERGECPDAKGHNQRFSHKLAIAPNASSSIICGNTSPGVEPIPANIFTQKTLSGSSELKNPRLKALLAKYDKDTEETWNIIRANSGSVATLDFLSDKEISIFKTAWEIDNKWIIEHAADRTPYICQSQSINLFLPSDVSKKELHELHMKAWKLDLKSLYYIRSTARRRAENVQEATIKHEFQFEECQECEA